MFFKKNQKLQHSELCKNDNKHVFITILKHFPFCFFFLLLLCKANNIKTKFEVLKCQNSKEIFSKIVILPYKLLGILKIRRFYPTMLYQRFIYASISLILDSYFFIQVILIQPQDLTQIFSLFLTAVSLITILEIPQLVTMKKIQPLKN